MSHDSVLPATSGRQGFAAACLLGALLAWLALAPRHFPAPSTHIGAPAAGGFSVVRAQAHVRALAAAPRPVGSRANQEARAYLLAQLRAIGLEPEVQTAIAQTASSDLTANVRVTLAEVHNVVVKKPGMVSGHAGRPAVLAVAHYDSGSATLGAADGAASSAALLETLRVLQAGPPLDNDLLVVFTDGDAGQALGTRGFVQAHPWARRARVALRFDNPGNRGALQLIGAERADGFAVQTWAGLAPDPQGSSLMGELYATLPQHEAAALLGGPDGAGAPAQAAVLHFATTAGPLGDGAGDIPERLDSASLQHEGDTMLTLLRRFGSTHLPEPGVRGQVFFALPGLGMLHYAYPLVWPLSLLVCLLCAAAWRNAVRREKVDSIDIVHGAFGFLMTAMLAIGAAWLCRDAQPGLAPRYDAGLLAGGPGLAASVRWQLLVFTLLPVAVFIALQRKLQERLGVTPVALGAMCTLSLALLGASWFVPGASYVLAWPLLAALSAFLVLSSRRARAWTRARRLAVLLAAAVPAAFLILPAARDSLLFVSPTWLVLPGALACCLPALCGPLLAEVGARLVVRPLLLGVCACMVLAHRGSPTPPALPQPNQLVYFKDTPSWQAFWLYPPVPLDAWTRQVFPNTMHPYQLPYLFGSSAGPVWYAAAKRDDSVAYPYLIIEKDQRGGDVRHVEVLMRSKNSAPEIVIRLVGADTLKSSLNGRVLTARRYRGWKLDLHGMQDRELRFAFDLVGDPPFLIFIQERMPGLPDRDLPARPAGMLPRLLPQTGTTVSADVLYFR
ncbi:hypothetical protein AB595_26590 [Massilia sp. WF1]|uniref:M28 family peptidase n=1 Tax=unclassified Massilia TaxID=2609279 RepID=UPI0006893607|nr:MULTISPECIES: M28 family peptidase [unclassified Massilia]ALK95317.1 hypothetical protein AM586_02450 [Massilia sp. WG5]KNZ67351.1 hypothetical protein AB595_26590 [Massilia sp. WF1]